MQPFVGRSELYDLIDQLATDLGGLIDELYSYAEGYPNVDLDAWESKLDEFADKIDSIAFADSGMLSGHGYFDQNF